MVDIADGPNAAVELMKAAFDEIMATAVKRQHEPARILGDLLNTEISEKLARSIKYQLTIATLAPALLDRMTHHCDIVETGQRQLALQKPRRTFQRLNRKPPPKKGPR